MCWVDRPEPLDLWYVDPATASPERGIVAGGTVMVPPLGEPTRPTSAATGHRRDVGFVAWGGGAGDNWTEDGPSGR